MALFSAFRNTSRRVLIFSLSPSSFSTSTSVAPQPPKLKNVGYYYRKLAMEAAVVALKDYLYYTSALPFHLAENIALNSPISLSSYIRRLRFPSKTLKSSDLPQLLRHSFSFREPINEFEFFLESIGVSDKPSSSESLFLSDDPRLVQGVTQLIHLGFPYNKLCHLYPSKALWVAPNELVRRFRMVYDFGISETNCVLAVCFAFPNILIRDDVDSLLQDLRAFFVSNHMLDLIENKVDNYLDICQKIQIFYELGSAEGSIGSILRDNAWVILDIDKEGLRKRLGFFCKIGHERKLGAVHFRELAGDF